VTQRQVAWRPARGPGIERVALRTSPAFIADALVVGRRWAVTYRLRCDRAGTTRALDVAVLGGRGVRLRHDGRGRWRIDGRRVRALDGCRDADLSCTPLTNALPIRRLRLAVGASCDIRVALVAVPSLTVATAVQTYRRLAGDRYRFTASRGRFQRSLRVDRDGLVVDYPGLFRRLR